MFAGTHFRLNLGGLNFMKNTKHRIVGLVAVAMIGTMSARQAIDFKASNRLAALLNKNEEVTTFVAPETIKVTPEQAKEKLNETYTEEEIKNIEDAKSAHQDSYVLLTSGTLDVYDIPSEDGTVTDALPQTKDVKVIESTDGWFKILYDDGKTGYVSKEKVTDSKAEADYAAMHYDNYKKAKVKTNGSPVNIRSAASSDASIIGKLDNGSDLVLLYDDNGYTKVYYGADLEPGFIVSTSIELTNTWMPKSEASNIQAAAARRKAAEAKAREEAAAQARAQAAATTQTSSNTTTQTTSTNTETKSSTYTAPAPSSKGQAIVNEAKKYLGVKYVWGGTSPKGFDCSGLVQYVCKSLGISVNRTAAAQFSNGKAVNKADLQPGDLVFFAKSKRISHVGIYVGNGQMLHAPHTGDVVKIASMNTSYYTRTYVGARRVY